MTSSVLKMQHTSLQFSDSSDQQASDVEKLFSKGKAFPIKTGTEASDTSDLFKLVKEAASDYNHIVHFARGNFIAVDRDIIKRRTARRGSVFVISNDRLVGRMHDRVFPTLAFTHVDDRIGRIAQATAHYATRGAKLGDPNYEANRLYAQKLGNWMRTAGRGGALAFVNGDFNMNDRNLDWAWRQDFTSMADELDAWKNTGHGPIDGFCSYNKDARVKAKRFQVLDDSELHLHSDHYACRGTWTVRHLKTK